MGRTGHGPAIADHRGRALPRAPSHGAERLARIRLGVHREESRGEVLQAHRRRPAAARHRAVEVVALHRGGEPRDHGGGSPMSGPPDRDLPRLFRLPSARHRLRRDIDRELRFHIEGRIEELVAQGRTRQEAEREVRERFGDLGTVREQLEEIDTMTHRKRELGEWRSALARDVRHALRGLVQRPAFAAVVILTLGLGIGATTAIYALLDAVVLRPLPYPNASRLVYIEHPVPGVETNARWRMSQAGYF